LLSGEVPARRDVTVVEVTVGRSAPVAVLPFDHFCTSTRLHFGHIAPLIYLTPS
jgi:hypothetical protein